MKKLSKLKLKSESRTIMSEGEMKMILGGYSGESCREKTACSGGCTNASGKSGTCKVTPIAFTCDCWT